jgi:hypothetical protein
MCAGRCLVRPVPPLAIQAFFLPRMAPGDLLISEHKRIGDLARLNLGGLLLRYNLIGLRLAQRLALSAAVSALATAGLTIGLTKPALAEFEIQESQVEQGEVELEYRGAVHWGFPKAEREEAEEAEEGEGEEEAGEVAEEEEEGEFLRQSHDFEFAYGISDRLLFSTTFGTDEPLEENYDLSSIELELQYEIIQRRGNGLGLAFMGGYGIAYRDEEADEIEFGPIVELASGNLLLTLNPFFSAQVGDYRETDGLGFEYGWRAEYDFAKHWGVGVEMFGEIEDLSNAGSFNEQAHSLGPTLFYNPGGDDDDEGEGEGGNGDDDENEVAEAPETEFSLNVGVQFGLTDVTSDTALKFQGSLAF